MRNRLASEGLRALPRQGAHVFSGSRGGERKPGTVRSTLISSVIAPLRDRFPGQSGARSFAEGRLRGFRRFFASHCARSGAPIQTIMSWLGRHDSDMVRCYHHLAPPTPHARLF